MNPLKQLLNLSIEHKLLVSLSFILLLSIPLAILQVNNLKVDREKKLEQFYQQQNQKKIDLEKTYEQIKKEQAEQQAKEEREAQKIAEEIDKNFNANLPDCSKLKNRINIVIVSNNCDYNVRALGTTTMAVVFVSEKIDSFWTGEANKLKTVNNSKTSLHYTNTFLKKEAHRYGKSNVSIKFSFFGPYKITKSLENIYYRENQGKYLETLSVTSQKNKVPEQNYDLVHYVYLSDSYGGSAFPGSHRAFTNASSSSGAGVFIHETLHLFKASDKYNNDECNTIGRANPFDKTEKPQQLTDIMCSASLDHGIINRITAREIGWPN